VRTNDEPGVASQDQEAASRPRSSGTHATELRRDLGAADDVGGEAVHGGIKVYRGTAAAARHYVEADRSRVDDYYLAEGTGLADRLAVTPAGVQPHDPMDGDAYERWVAGYDVDIGLPKGRLRTDENAVRFVEVVVNGPKSWSLAAALHPDVAAAYEDAQDRAAHEIIAWLGEHATTRIGPRGRQVQVPVEQLEAAVMQHYTSRAGDPHRHLHLQINARIWAAGKWRGIHTVGVRAEPGRRQPRHLDNP
jgi:exodeoxyribonuclease V alpha subunit